MTQDEIDYNFGALCYEAYNNALPDKSFEELSEYERRCWIAAAKAVRSAFAASVLT